MNLRFDWKSSLRRRFGPVKRRVRRLISARHFKEYYVNESLMGRRDSIYVEIGVRSGDSFRTVRADRKIGIDPERSEGMTKLRPGEEFYCMTSDEFFISHAQIVLADSLIDVALVDGLHEFHQVLRDVLNLERHMAHDGLIVLDDCNPLTAELASDRPTGASWNGDVWKIAAFLAEVRPDLDYVTVDADFGIGLVAGFEEKHAFPTEEVTATFKQLDYSYLDSKRSSVLRLVSPDDQSLERASWRRYRGSGQHPPSR